MAGKSQARISGDELEQKVLDIARGLGLDAKQRVRVGRRLWGSEREIDVVVTDKDSRKSLGIECKAQSSRGSAEEKLVGVINDIEAWPIPGILVFGGTGFSKNITSFLYSTGKAVTVDDLETWLKLYFGL